MDIFSGVPILVKQGLKAGGRQREGRRKKCMCAIFKLDGERRETTEVTGKEVQIYLLLHPTTHMADSKQIASVIFWRRLLPKDAVRRTMQLSLGSCSKQARDRQEQCRMALLQVLISQNDFIISRAHGESIFSF